MFVCGRAKKLNNQGKPRSRDFILYISSTVEKRVLQKVSTCPNKGKVETVRSIWVAGIPRECVTRRNTGAQFRLKNVHYSKNKSCLSMEPFVMFCFLYRIVRVGF